MKIILVVLVVTHTLSLTLVMAISFTSCNFQKYFLCRFETNKVWDLRKKWDLRENETYVKWDLRTFETSDIGDFRDLETSGIGDFRD